MHATPAVIAAGVAVIVLLVLALAVWAFRRRDPDDETEQFAHVRQLTASWSGPTTQRRLVETGSDDVPDAG